MNNYSYRPLVSIITVVLNGAGTLEKTIQSIIGQDYDNIEYIIIDGGSSDGTLDIIRRYEDKIFYWISEPDRGIFDAFNKGIRQCHGELIGILNSDDWYESCAVSQATTAHRSDLSAGVIHGDLLLHNINNTSFLFRPHTNSQRMRFEMIYRHPTCFVAKRVYEQFGLFDINLKVVADYEFLFRLYNNGVKFHYIPQILANMRTGGNSDRKFIICNKETTTVMIKYGYPKYKAYLWFVYRIITETITSFIGRIRMLRLREFLLKGHFLLCA